MLGVYTDVLFAEHRGSSPCLEGGEEDTSNVMVIAFYQTTDCQFSVCVCS